LVARALEINQDNIYYYFLFLDNLKQYQQKHFAEQPHLLDFFYDLSVYQLIHENNYINGDSNPLLELLQDLSKLKDAIPKDRNAWLYASSRDALIESIRLTQEIISVIPRDTLDTQKVNFQEKISALSFTIKAATKVVENPFSPRHQEILYANTQAMRTYQEGAQAKDIHDHPKNNAFAAALETICGIALMLIAAILQMASPALGVVTFLYGSHCAYQGVKRMVMTEDPWTFHNPEEKRLAVQSIIAGAAFCKLADIRASFFYRNKPAKTVSYPEVELQSLSALRV
jgi:hypothetical protein